MINRKISLGIALIIICTVSLFVALWPVKAQNNITVYVDPSEIYASVCEDFDVHIKIDNPSNVNIGDYDIFLFYDNTQMTPVTAVEGDYLMPPTLFMWEDLGDSVHAWSATLDGPQNAATGILTTITFHCDAPGVSTLTLEVMLSDEYGNPIYPDFILHGTVYQEVPVSAHTYINPPLVTVPICTPFTVDVMVDNVSDLYSFDLLLSYDTAFVDAIDIKDGGFLPPPTLELVKVIDDAAGIIQYSLTSLAPTGAYGSGAIARVTFHCTGAGESSLNIDSILLFDSIGLPIPTTKTDGRAIQIPYWEPLKLQHLVEWPGRVAYADLPWYIPYAEGHSEIKAAFEAKGYTFVETEIVALSLVGVAPIVEGDPHPPEEFSGNATSWWSSNTLEDGTRACLTSVEMDDTTSMALGFITNLLPTEQIPGVDPWIIYNAEPYFFIEFYWWAWHPIGRIIRWPYWWHNSHNHPNWYWGPYWWWRIYTKAYFLGMPWPPVNINWVFWRPWWGWWWHWVYWRHWYWWSSYFPYDP